MSDIKRKINSDLDDRMTLDWQGTRAFFYGLGYNDADIEKPRVGIMNTWNEINPGHIHQRHLADAVHSGILIEIFQIGFFPRSQCQPLCFQYYL